MLVFLVAVAVNAVFEGAGGASIEDGVVFIPTFGTVPIPILSGLIRLTAFGSLSSQKPSLIKLLKKATESDPEISGLFFGI